MLPAGAHYGAERTRHNGAKHAYLFWGEDLAYLDFAAKRKNTNVLNLG